MNAPFPWFGGKRRIAKEVWSRFGDVAVYAEPFAGALGVLLRRPEAHWLAGRIETINDIDGFVCNAWRAILHDPEQTARTADWPANENDLHARHAWLIERRESLSARLEGDPDFHDPKIAGWWLWGLSQWIGGEFCSGRGPWWSIEVEPGNRQLVRVGGDQEAGMGVRRRIHLSGGGQGVSRRRLHLNGDRGVKAGLVSLVPWFCALSERLRLVRITCGDWSRILTSSALAPSVGGVRGILLDPPYGVEDRAQCYSHDSTDPAALVAEWCRGAPPDYRIALCGYSGEHEELEQRGWRVLSWTGGGMQRDKRSPGNRERERVWFSPACLRPGLFDAPAPDDTTDDPSVPLWPVLGAE